ncbi:3-isopropylmalate dehydrogenase [Candidatus Tremblaya phenacola]|uniref:3-isopropylmalate dehydrogenase n=1 Tax=Candidatus Tremblayella phenacoccinincola TaxID=1010676 RepID=A0A2G0V7B4_9PROT|nr:3-isopropylmalate dehydrogenase [Candidatus Tremblaya phenacola]
MNALTIRQITIKESLIGRTAFESTGSFLPVSTVNMVKASDAVLLGSVGANRTTDITYYPGPETALLKLRKLMSSSINLRPIKHYDSINTSFPNDNLKGTDILVLRELTSGIYFGKPKIVRKTYAQTKATSLEGVDTMKYSESEVRSIAHVAFKSARNRKKKILSVDKANVLESSKVWRSMVLEVSKSYNDVRLWNNYIDSAVIEILANPREFDVVLSGNLFGDILSDQLSIVSGSLGMLPSASLGFNGKGLYEPVHGSAPSLTHKNLANPIAAILSLAMLLRYSFHLNKQASMIDNAVVSVLKRNYKTSDISNGKRYVSTSEMGDLIASLIRTI